MCEYNCSSSVINITVFLPVNISCSNLLSQTILSSVLSQVRIHTVFPLTQCPMTSFDKVTFINPNNLSGFIMSLFFKGINISLNCAETNATNVCHILELVTLAIVSESPGLRRKTIKIL